MANNHAVNHQEQLAQQLFCTRDAYNALRKLSHSPKNTVKVTTVVFNDVVQLVQGNNQPDFMARVPFVFKKINSEVNFRKVYLQLIKQLRFAECGLQAAASSGELLTNRVTEHFTLKFKRDPCDASQVYVILFIANPTEKHLNHDIALHITDNEHADCLYFPPLIDGRSQQLMDESDNQLSLLTNNNSHLYLM